MAQSLYYSWSREFLEAGKKRLSGDTTRQATTDVKDLRQEIGAEVPEGGRVDVLFFTDRQYENIQSYRARSTDSRPEKPDQLQLF